MEHKKYLQEIWQVVKPDSFNNVLKRYTNRGTFIIPLQTFNPEIPRLRKPQILNIYVAMYVAAQASTRHETIK